LGYWVKFFEKFGLYSAFAVLNLSPDFWCSNNSFTAVKVLVWNFMLLAIDSRIQNMTDFPAKLIETCFQTYFQPNILKKCMQKTALFWISVVDIELFSDITWCNYEFYGFFYELRSEFFAIRGCHEFALYLSVYTL
jgi:hypothetical protein